MSLYRVWQGTLERARLEDPLNSHCAYLLIDNKEAQTFTWNGSSARRFDVVLAEKIARAVQQDDLRAKKPVQTASEDETDGPVIERFRSLHSGQLRIDSQPPADNSDVIIYTASVENDDTCELTEARRVTRNDKGTIPPIQPDEFTGSSAVVVEAGIEVFVWCGQGVDSKAKAAIQNYVKVRRSQT